MLVIIFVAGIIFIVGSKLVEEHNAVEERMKNMHPYWKENPMTDWEFDKRQDAFYGNALRFIEGRIDFEYRTIGEVAADDKWGARIDKLDKVMHANEEAYITKRTAPNWDTNQLL